MMRVLVLEDNPYKGEQLRAALERAEHHAVLVCDDFCDGLRDKTLAHLERDPWDALVLDIHFSTDALGGFHVYNELVRRGVRCRWTHTLLYTRYAVPNIESATSGEAVWVRLFAETARISFDCVFTKEAQDQLVEKIGQLGEGGRSSAPDVEPIDPDVIKDWQWIYRELQLGNLASYQGQYIAVVARKVVASGLDPKDVCSRACEATSSPQERVVLFWVDQ